ncbi:2Fe-2S iron-sulfur cluster binding domain-containing protein [Cryomorpha ignava]|uniref:2Fe-2S iron-sulfur cluster binding domain-containing protein n=1 Tax=Cryomorpha ignava TaxID=101383 RepID=A0A7K3WQA0_9FLAO|nr:2Fe-2S iron-sulfur cluster-binding protein [Cryomorpha ignava]NEN23062.1 2Fe-2S iron-sulfur cluster binding domain-containing protein [Cryomorpha ignava]
MKNVCFTIIDTIGESHLVEVKPYAYNSLMEFIVDELYEEIGDCMGRAWCGTCILRQINGRQITQLEPDEKIMLEKYPNPDKDWIRLSCQIEITPDLENTCWEIVDSRLIM